MILRTELRRSTAPVLGIGLVVFSLGLVYSLTGPWIHGTAPWNEQWTGLAQWTRYLTLFLWPLVLGIGAWQGLRDHRSRVTELFAATPMAPWRRPLPTVGAVAVALTAGYLVLLVVGGVQVAANTSYFHLRWLPVAGVMVLALTGIALLGFGIGRLLPSLVTPPVLAVAALAAQIAVLQQGWPLLLTPAFDAPDITAFTTVAVPVSLTQALWFTGIGATGFLLAVAVRARARFAALLPVALAAAVTVPVLSAVDSPVVADADAMALVCDDDGPRVCVRNVHADHLPALTGPAREALALLGKLPAPPTSVTEFPAAGDFRSPSPEVVPVLFFAGPVTDPEWVRLTVLAGAGTPPCDNTTDWEVARDQEAARIVAASWFTGELAPVPGSRYVWDTAQDDIHAAWQGLRSLPAAEQTARVAAYRDAALDCRGGLSTLVTP
ncbi:hypothetical protein [Actinophytocola glycyrrhizae]|uniref:ABC-type transport system involved in multi-copper enzyme maturation permease subunit n=1 Tax=Actinophytocola glycyrrhizae TaxID=2044873 RepID=A0ABV9SFW6_9PSEU